MSTINESVKEAAEKLFDSMEELERVASISASVMQDSEEYRFQWVNGVAAIIQETCFTLRPIETAPRDGRAVFLQMKSDENLPQSIEDATQQICVGRISKTNRGWWDIAPFYGTALNEKWIEGWMPLPGTKEAK